MLEFKIRLEEYLVDHLIVECEREKCTISKLIEKMLQEKWKFFKDEKIREFIKNEEI